MSNFDLLFPVTPFKKVFPSSKMRELDDRWPKIPNWVDGSTHTLAAGQTVELLKGDNLSAFVLNLKVGIVDTITIAPDAALVLSASSGHPSAAIWQGFSTATFESGATLEFQSGAIAGWDSGAEARFGSGATCTVQSGGTLSAAAGSTVNVASALGVHLTGTQPAATADPGADNIVISTLVCKAWGNVSIGNNSATMHGGANIASLTIDVSNDFVLVTFARPMADANYCVTFGVRHTTGTPSPVHFPIANNQTVNGFELWDFDGCGANAGGTAASAYSMAGGQVGHISFEVKGRQ